jgi:NAD(P)-dependent dehydrogenase (short-subunit alcohol dehydrogenase family)/acyl carrier protein
LAILAQCGPNLADVLRGRVVPLSLLCPDHSHDLLEGLYSHSPTARATNATVREVIAAAVAALPPTGRLRVLEVGAGTGGTTAAILDLLPPHRTEYLFTDLSPRFLTRARERFADFPFVRCEVFDLNRAPEEQGLGRGEFDLIVAANAAHAATDVRRALGRLSGLLTPQGLLVLVEGTDSQPWLDLTLGLTDGWWTFADTDRRPNHPLLPAAAWLALLEESGLGEACLAGLPEGDPGRGQVVLLASRPGVRVNWTLVADRCGVAAALARLITSFGGQCACVEPGQPLRPPESGPWEVVHLAGLDAALETEPGATEQALETCRAALDSVRAVLQGPAGQAARLWLVTRGAQAVAERESPALAQAGLWGLGRCLGLEQPTALGGLIDLCPEAATLQSAQALWEQLQRGDEELVAFRSESRLAARWQAAPPAPAASFAVRPEGAYLVTGGLTGLGLEMAGWLVRRGARHLVLVGRRPPSPEVADRIRRWTQSGVDVRVRQADVSRPEELAWALAGTPRLTGVFHCAGELSDGMLGRQTWDEFARVFPAKVAGAWELHRLTQQQPLDCFVLFSTATVWLGSTGQANHAAANAFLDALAHYRRSRGLPALSVGWGPWASVGSAAAPAVAERGRKRGLAALSVEEGLAALEALLAEGAVHRCVVPMDWPTFLAQLPPGRHPAFFDREAGPRPAAAKQPPGLLERVLAAPAGRRREVLLEGARQEALAVLGLPVEHRLDLQQPLQEAGLDSLLAVELRNRLSRSLDCRLPATLLYDYPTVAGLAVRLGDQLRLPPSGADSVPSEDPELAGARTLPDEAVNRLLAELSLAVLEETGRDHG